MTEFSNTYEESDYDSWASVQPNGSDTSVEAYRRYVDSNIENLRQDW